MKKLRKLAIFLFFTAIYMNAGYVIAKYDNEHRTCVVTESKSLMEKFIRGPNSSLYETRECKEDFKISKQPTVHFIFALIWPLFIIVPAFTWMVAGLGLLLESIIKIISFTIWFVFGGGIIKSLNLI